MKTKMGFTTLFLVILLSLSTCGIVKQTATPAAPLTSSPGQPTALPAQPAETAGEPSPTPLPTDSVINIPAPLYLQVDSPRDGEVVTTSQVTVTGSTLPGAVVTVNDEILLVGADGRFQAVVTLDEGPNLIEVIASDDAGNETSFDFTVSYEP